MMYVCNLNQMQNKHHHWDISYRDKEVCERASVTLWSSRFDCLAPKRLLRSPSNVTLLTAFFFSQEIVWSQFVVALWSEVVKKCRRDKQSWSQSLRLSMDQYSAAVPLVNHFGLACGSPRSRCCCACGHGQTLDICSGSPQSHIRIAHPFLVHHLVVSRRGISSSGRRLASWTFESTVNPGRRLGQRRCLKLPSRQRRCHVVLSAHGPRVAGASKNGSVGLLGPPQESRHGVLLFARPRIITKSHCVQSRKLVEDSGGQAGETVGVQVEPSEPGEAIQRARQDLGQVVVWQVHRFQIVRHVGGHGPKVVVAQVEGAQTGEGVVDEDHPFQLVGRQIQCLQVPVVGRVVFVQWADVVPHHPQVPEGARQRQG